jgi:hypothetical protein
VGKSNMTSAETWTSLPLPLPLPPHSTESQSTE